MNKVKTVVVSIMMMFGLVATPIELGSVSYAANKDQACQGVSSIGGRNACTGDAGGRLSGFIQNIINILLFLIGAIAVIMIIVGGIRYVVSGGDQGAITGAKNTILYAVIGLVIAILAYAIVNFVLGAL